MRLSLGRFVLVVACGLAAIACGLGITNGTDPGNTSSEAADGGDATSSATNTHDDGGALIDGGGALINESGILPVIDSGGNDPRSHIIYAHTATDLYKLDPTQQPPSFTQIGPLTNCANLTDIAVDKNGKIVGGGDDLYDINEATGACTKIASGKQPFTLTFAPENTLDVTETLVAFDGPDYVRIDQATGMKTIVKAGALAPYAPSGDVVSVKGGNMFVSVTGSGCGDCLLETSAVDGHIIKNWGALGYSQMFGLGYWHGAVYCFRGEGSTYAITFGATTVTATLINNANKPSAWVGAGSSTLAEL